MTKNLLIASLVTLLFSFNSYSQITLESTDMTAIGDEILRYVDTIPLYGPGGDGPDQLWDFSNAVADTLNNTEVVTIASTPFASTFSSSTYAMTNNNLSYLYFTHDANSMTTTGAAGDLLNNGDQIESEFSDPLVLHQFPRTYGSNFHDTYAFITEASGNGLPTPIPVHSVRLTHNGHVYDTTDAYGTLITPTGTYDALRVKSVDFTTDLLEYKLFSFSPWATFGTTVDTSVSYSWHAKEEMLAIAEYAYDSIGNPARFTYSTVLPVVTTGISDAEDNSVLTIYPQPTSAQLCIRSSMPFTNAYAQVYSLEGKMVLNEKVNSTCFDVSELDSGMYLLRLTTADGKELFAPKKFIKQ